MVFIGIDDLIGLLVEEVTTGRKATDQTEGTDDYIVFLHNH
jgi:hypothetical protein